MDGVKAFLTRQIGPFPVYAYAIGVAALIGGIIYFRMHSNTGAATVAPQTNYATDANGVPLPYPNPGSGAPGIPPSSAFDMSGATSVPQYTSQSTFVPTAPSNTSSQDFAASVTPSSSGPAAVDAATLYPGHVQGSTRSTTPTPGPSSQLSQLAAATYNIPIIGRIIAAAAANPSTGYVPQTANRGKFA